MPVDTESLRCTVDMMTHQVVIKVFEKKIGLKRPPLAK